MRLVCIYIKEIEAFILELNDDILKISAAGFNKFDTKLHWQHFCLIKNSLTVQNVRNLLYWFTRFPKIKAYMDLTI